MSRRRLAARPRLSSAAVAPLFLVALGLFALLAAAALLASLGTGVRVGRLIAGTPRIPLADLAGEARLARPRYVAIEGRIDSEDEFEDAAHRPLVFRRTLVQLRDRGARRVWRTVDESREAVPFSVADASGSVALDPADLDVGLVVVPREAMGVAADVPDRVPGGTPPDAPVRIRIQQVSSVEHATVLGIPERTADGLRLRPGDGRPLVLTTLDQPEAMRILADGRQPLIRLAVALAAAGAGLIVLGIVAAALGVGP
jgi:hypothetical protein